MKRFFILIVISFFAVSTAFSTEQIPDILIIENDTVYLKSFPLDFLRFKNREITAPFYYKYGFPNTACWRGYVATWKIVENYLLLEKVAKIDCDSTLNIIEYFQSNGYNPKIMNGFVVADWYSDTLKRYDLMRDYHKRRDKFYLSTDYSKQNNKRAELVFENGKITKNNIIPIEDYKV